MPNDVPAASEKDVMEQVLCSEVVGHLGMASGDEPYVVPINYVYLEGKIVMHCALAGKKLQMIRRNPSVCFVVSRQEGSATPHDANQCDMPFESVICYGTARIVNDLEERVELLNQFQRRYDTPEKQREPITAERAQRCGAIVIEVESMTGRKHPGKHWFAWVKEE